jgi:hypothetical protein
MGKKIFVIDSQFLGTMMQCPRKYHLEHILNLRPIKGYIPFERGWDIHYLMQEYYTAKMKNVSFKLKDTINDVRVIAARQQIDLADLESLFIAFREYIELNKNETWIPRTIEKVFVKTLYEDNELKIVYVGKIDLIVETNVGLAIVDHKTYKRKYPVIKLNIQFAGYSWATGIPYLVVNKLGLQDSGKPEAKHYRVMLHYNKRDWEEFEEIAIFWAKQMIIRQEADFYEPNWSSCDKFGGCVFRHICGNQPEVRESLIRRDFIVGEQWDVSKEKTEED